MKNIVVLVTLDTKGEAAGYLKELISQRGHQALIVDVGCGTTPKLQADVTAAEVALAGGADITELRSRGPQERESATETMIRGAVVKLRALYETGQMEGVISIGGMSSAVMASTIMKEIPSGIPKLLLTSAASLPGSYRLFGPTGVTVMHSLVEVGGLNRLLRGELNRAAGAICGMSAGVISPETTTAHKPLVAMTTNGWVEACAQQICKALEDMYEIIRFHATGMPEVVMEKLIEENYFSGIIDLVPSSITNERFGGSRISWPRRLEVAGEKGIPQVIAPSLVDVISRTRDSSPELASEIAQRKYYYMDSLRVLLWLNTEELKSLIPVYAAKLNKAMGPTKVIMPMKGWLSLENENSEFYNKQGIEEFARGLKEKLKPEIEMREVDDNIESSNCAQAVVAAFRDVMSVKESLNQSSVFHRLGV